jgi:hypothetical protein
VRAMNERAYAPFLHSSRSRPPARPTYPPTHPPKHTLQTPQVTLSDTHLNISSLVGPMSMELLPPPGSEASNPTSGLFQRLLNNNDNAAGAFNPVSAAKRAAPKYPFCEMRPHGLTLMEYGAFSFLAYLEKDSPSFHAFFRAAFDPQEWEIVRGPEPRAHGAVFLDAFNRRLNTSVVATRGTNPKNLFDIFQVLVFVGGLVGWGGRGLFGVWSSRLLPASCVCSHLTD